MLPTQPHMYDINPEYYNPEFILLSSGHVVIIGHIARRPVSVSFIADDNVSITSTGELVCGSVGCGGLRQRFIVMIFAAAAAMEDSGSEQDGFSRPCGIRTTMAVVVVVVL